METRILDHSLVRVARAVAQGGHFTYRVIEQEGLEGLLRRTVQAALNLARVAQRWHTGKLRRNLVWIAVSLAVECPRLTLYAIDTSADALEVAAQNVKRHGVSERVWLLQGDLLAPLPEPVHLIAANLPYVSEAELAQLPPHIARFEPRLALDGGPDGLAVVERLLAQARTHLRPEGAILLEIGVAQGDLALGHAQRFFPDAQVQVRQDYGARDRLLIIQI